MDNTENRKTSRESGRVWAALALILIGSALVLERMGFPMPYWLFTWPMILILIGLFVGFKHGFRGPGWAVMILIGSFFLIDDVIPDFSLHRYIWPVGIIFLGILILVRPRKRNWEHWKEEWKNKDWGNNWKESAEKYKSYSGEDYIDATTVFGGIHKAVVSKNFKGGDITVFMGGTEINLSQADINGTAILDITQIMGGTKLIVPPHWEIRSNLTSVFGSVEDKRQQEKVTNPDKVLLINGTSIFGGIEIKNF